jgi:serine/threonine-protein kinase
MEAGQLLGARYRLASEIGRGGMAVVWRAHDTVLDREVAVKVLAPMVGTDAGLLARLRAEARAAARLRHRHIMTVHDYGETADAAGVPVPYVVMELVDGRSLSATLADGPLPWPEAVRICAQVAAALAHAHARGIVHRDVKPDNVILTAAGATLVDFGISASVGETDLAPDGSLLGTPAYLAPERLDAGPVRAACDVYGLGLLLYKSLTGRLPWPADPTPETLVAHRHADAPPLPPVPSLPPAVAQLCRRCLARRPQDRPGSAGAARVLRAAAGWPAATGPTRVAGASRAAMPPSGTAELLEPTEATTAAGPAPPARRTLVGALALAGILLAATLSGSPSPPPAGPPDGGGPAAHALGTAPGAAACEVRYDVRRDSGSDFVAAVTLVNTGAATVRGWRLAFAFPADQRLERATSATWRQSGNAVVVAAAPDATLPAGRSVTFELAGSYRKGNPLPVIFRLNDTGCLPLLTAVAGTGDGPEGRGESADVRTRAEPGRGAGAGAGDTDEDSGGPGNGRGGGGGNSGPGGGDDSGPGEDGGGGSGSG